LGKVQEKRMRASSRNARDPSGSSDNRGIAGGRTRTADPSGSTGPRTETGTAPPPRRAERSGTAARLERPETWRTPGSAAGCNKPAKCMVEQTVEAGKNGKGGTSPGRGSPGPKVAPRRQAESLGMTHGDSSSEQRGHREWTPGIDVDGGADFDNPTRGVRRPHGREASGREARRRAHHGGRTAQAGLSLRRRSEGHEGRAVWSTRPQGAREREVPRSPSSSSNEVDGRSRRACGEGQRSTTRPCVGNTALRPWSQWRRGQRP